MDKQECEGVKESLTNRSRAKDKRQRRSDDINLILELEKQPSKVFLLL